MKVLRLLPVLVLSFLFIGGFLLVIQVSGASATDIVVDTLEDELDDDGDCSLREAITAANDNTSVDSCSAGQSGALDRISFDISGTITLTEQLTVTTGGALEIDGGEEITISGNDNVRVMNVTSNADLSLVNLGIKEGKSTGNGGGINNAGTLTITNSTLFNNSVSAGEITSGGGINNVGTLKIINSLLHGNNASAGILNFGGSIYNSGTLSITGSTLDGNYVDGGDSSYGGGIFNIGSLSISDSSFSDNSAFVNGGGAIHNDEEGTAIINNSNFFDNHADLSGGGIINLGLLIIESSTILSNTSDSVGGGITNHGMFTITNSIIISNTASAGGGFYNGWNGIGNIIDTTINGNYAADSGGGIFVYLGATSITNSTISENFVISRYETRGAGIYNRSILTITNSTLSNNYALSLLEESYGGGIYHHTGIANIINCTFVGNSASYGGGIYTNKTLKIINNIISYSPSGGNCVGPIIDGGHNLDDGISCGFTAGSNTDPLLGPLQENGGPTDTNAPMPGSPAIDSASSQHCPDTDQRGAPRPLDGDGDGESVCDIGAVEFIRPSIIINADEPDPSLIFQPFTVTFSVTSTFEMPTGVVSVTVNDTQKSCTNILTDGSGSCQLTIDDPGIYNLTATYRGDTVHNPSNDNELHTVNPAGTTTTITGDTPDPSLVNQPFTITFSVSSTIGLPTGVVSITVSESEENCSDSLSEGFGSCQLTLSSPGTYTLTTAYLGDDIHSPSSVSELHDVILLKLFLPHVNKDDQP